MGIRTYLGALAVVCAMAAPASAADDLTIVSKTTTTGPGGHTGTSTTYMTAGKLRVTQERSDIIFDVASGTITMIDNEKKQYWQMTKADMEALSKAFSDRMAQMQKDPQAAAVMQKMMGAVGPAKLEKGTETKTVAGYPCTQYTLSMGEGTRMVYWTTTALQAPITWEQWANAESGILRANPIFARMSTLFDEMKNLKGIPLATSTTMAMGPMKVETSSEATSVKTGAIPASTFDIPATYKKVESPATQMQKKQ
jgi:hypothetical protein